jgi:hypothetical protein
MPDSDNVLKDTAELRDRLYEIVLLPKKMIHLFAEKYLVIFEI